MLNHQGNKGSWTPEEDAKLMEGHRRFGNRWTDIARLVPGRTDNAVKNRYAALVAKNEAVKSPKVVRWSDMCHLPKDQAAPESPSSPSSATSEGSVTQASKLGDRKRASPSTFTCDDAAVPSVKRTKIVAGLDLNASPDGAAEVDEGENSSVESVGLGLDLNAAPVA
jgi:hypothetical protein